MKWEGPFVMANISELCLNYPKCLQSDDIHINQNYTLVILSAAYTCVVYLIEITGICLSSLTH